MNPYVSGAKVAIVGGGVSALFTALKLSRLAPYATITIICDGDSLPGNGASAYNQKTLHRLGSYYLVTSPDAKAGLAKADALTEDAAELLKFIDQAQAFIGSRRGAVIALDKEADELILERFDHANRKAIPFDNLAHVDSARIGVAAYESGDLTYDVFRLAEYLGARLTSEGHRILFNARADQVTKLGKIKLRPHQGNQVVAWDRVGKHEVKVAKRGWAENFDVVVLAAGVGIPRIGGDWQIGSDLRFQTFQAGGFYFPDGDYRPYSADVAYSVARQLGSDQFGTFWALNADKFESPVTSVCLNEFTALWHDAQAELPHQLGDTQMSFLAQAVYQDLGRARSEQWAKSGAMKPFACAKLNVWRASEPHQSRNTDVAIYRASDRVLVAYSGKATHATATGRQTAELVVQMLEQTPAIMQAAGGTQAAWTKPPTSLDFAENTVLVVDDDGFHNVWRGATIDGGRIATALELEDVGPELRAAVDRWKAA